MDARRLLDLAADYAEARRGEADVEAEFGAIGTPVGGRGPEQIADQLRAIATAEGITIDDAALYNQTDLISKFRTAPSNR